MTSIHRIVTFTLSSSSACVPLEVKSFSFPTPSLIETLTVGREAFSEVKDISFIDLLNLKELRIEPYSFTRCRNTNESLVLSPSFGAKVVFENRSLKIRNCPRLSVVSIGEGSMQDVVHLELRSWFATGVSSRFASSEVFFCG